MPGGDDVASGRMERCGAIQEAWNVAERCNASQDAQDVWDAENTSLAAGRNADGSDAGSVFADAYCIVLAIHPSWNITCII